MINKKQKGFTLVEIAIVLVIVGLLIGGVLKGQEMITNAKLKRIESDNAGIAAAMFSYQDRYLQLPGDDGRVQGRFDIYTDATNDGNGNGLIEGLWTPPSAAPAAPNNETGLFWRHLRAAGLVPGGGLDSTQPSNAYGGLIGIRDGALTIAGHVTIFGQIEGPIAKILEARLDDGDPSTGRVQAGQSSGTIIDMDSATEGSDSYSDAERYSVAFRL
jgi:prepilin-type N-terminal cleavage/methylation domain-containing protein